MARPSPVLGLQAGDMAGGLLGMALQVLVCGGYGYLLVGRAWRTCWGGAFELAGACVLVGFVALSWIGGILAAASLFTWWLYLAAAAAIAVALRRQGSRPSPFPGASAPAAFQLAALLLLAGAAWLFARPAETFLLFEDSAVYTIAGINLAETGTLIPSVEPLISKFHQVTRYLGPFQWWDARPTTDTLSIGFLPTPKVWAALATWLFGRGGAVWSAPLSGILGMLALLLFLQRSVGRLAALVATALVSVSFPQVWYARVLMSETFAQTALFGGLYLLHIEREQNSGARPGAWGVAAALSLGLLSMIRFEAWLIVGAVLGGWLAAQVFAAPGLRLRWPAAWVPRWLAWLGGASLVAWGLSVAAAPHYYLNQLVLVLTRASLQLLVVAAVAVACGVALLRRWGAGLVRNLLRTGSLANIALMVLTLAWAVAAVLDLWLRGVANRGVTSWLALYLGWPGFALGAAGIVWLALSRPRAEVYALLTLTLISAIGYTLRPLVTRLHPWAIRRFVPYIVPALALGIGVLYGRIWATLRTRAPGRARAWRWLAAGALLLGSGLALASFGWATAPFVTYREAAGLWGQLEELAELYPSDAVLIFDDGPVGQRLPQVMELVFGRGAIAHAQPPGSLEFARLEAAIASAHAQGRKVFLNVTGGNLEWASELYGLRSYASYTAATPRMSYQLMPPPNSESIAPLRFLVDIYEVVPRGEMAPSQARTVSIPVTTGSYLHLRQGFYGIEADAQGRFFRWTGEYASLSVPMPPSDGALAGIEVWLDLAAWHPEAVHDTIVTVELQGHAIATARVEHTAEPQRFRIQAPYTPTEGQTTLEIGLRSTTWRPRDYGIEDERTLGAMLYGATVTFDSGDGGN